MSSLRTTLAAAVCALGVAGLAAAPASAEPFRHGPGGYAHPGWGGPHWGGPRWGGPGYYHGYHRGPGWGGAAALGALGLATGAVLASEARPAPVYYGYGGECRFTSWRHDAYGYPVKVITYRPC
ncbi:hypothetical protein ACFQ4O_06400 [Methylopila musalis]|uniref:Sulfur globule protein n=1 Tax=Methylopila musalis TaxID=1134781 RepID=A0ABW3Z5V2_9HYPH